MNKERMGKLLEENKVYYRNSIDAQVELFNQFCDSSLDCTEDEFLEYAGMMRAVDFDKEWQM